MTGITILACRYMAGRLDQFGPRRDETVVMTAFAATGDACMDRTIERIRRECRRGIVTHAAIITRGDMPGMLGCGDTRIMTGCTVAAVYAHVVEDNTRKGRKVIDGMAGRAIQARWNMVQGLAQCNIAVMT